MIEVKLEQLRNLFREMEQGLIAYSGGIDSTLVAKIAYFRRSSFGCHGEIAIFIT
jgi:PP-loop superfamily ATP-utilizing enzyme